MGNRHSSTENQNRKGAREWLPGFGRPGQRPQQKSRTCDVVKPPTSGNERQLRLQDSEKTDELHPPAYGVAGFLIFDDKSLGDELATLKSMCTSRSKAVVELHDAVYHSSGPTGRSFLYIMLPNTIGRVKANIGRLENALIRVQPALVPGHPQNLLGGANALVQELRALRDSIDEYVAELKQLMFGPHRCSVRDEKRVLTRMKGKRDLLQQQSRGAIRTIYAFRLTFDDELMATA